MSDALTSAAQLLEQMTPAEKAQVLQWAARDLGAAAVGVESRPGVCGGEACVVRTRIPVWLLEHARRLGVGEATLLRDFPALTAQDLVNAWAYARANRTEMESAITENEGD